MRDTRTLCLQYSILSFIHFSYSVINCKDFSQTKLIFGVWRLHILFWLCVEGRLQISLLQLSKFQRVSGQLLVLGLGGNQTIAPKENCPPVRVRVWLKVSFGVEGEGAVFLGGS